MASTTDEEIIRMNKTAKFSTLDVVSVAQDGTAATDVAASTEGGEEAVAATKQPSKKELKKMAKMAAKKADKAAAAAKAAGGATATTTTAATTTATATTTTTGTSSSTNTKASAKSVLELVNAKEGCPETLKVMWAANLFQITLQKAKSSPNNNNEIALLYNDQIVTSGNAILQALMFLSGTSAGSGSLMFQSAIDQWCEWEHNNLKRNNKNSNNNNNNTLNATDIQTLENALRQESSRHVVGYTTTIADISIVSTLTTAIMPPAQHSLTPLLQAYLDAHKSALDDAKQTFQEWNTTTAGLSLDMENTSVLAVLKQVFTATLDELYGGILPQLPLVGNWVAKCSNTKHGDYQCTAAMPLFAALKKANKMPPGIIKPQDVATAIIAAIGQDHPMIFDLQVNGPGFVLCRLTPTYLQHHINKFMQTGKLPKPRSDPITCVVDFSSPNIAKEMHVGHLRSTIIGESVCRILEFNGYTVHRVNHVGDWGTQFGMLIQFLKEQYPNFANEMPNITDLTQFYKAAKANFDDSAEFKKTSQLNVVKLQSGDKECLKIWNILCDVSRREFQKVYDRLGINVTECGESFYNDKITPVIEEFDRAGLVKIEEGGAKCVFVDGFQIPLMLQKSDGGFGYDSTDMAALKYRTHVLKAQRIIVITDFSQGDHFKMCYAAADKIGWLKNKNKDGDNAIKLAHIGFGTVMGEDGKRFKTRSGDTVRLVDLLDEAVRRMQESLLSRVAEKKTGIAEADVPQVAEAIGYSAVKYFDLRRNPTTNYKFSYDAMLDTKGNTAVYLLYAYARLESIISKAKADFQVDIDELMKNKESTIVIGHPSERGLVLQLQGFTDMMESTLEDLFPYHICDFVYNLSIAASDFATQCKVLGSPEMSSRLLLCKATTMAMKECFELVGIQHVQRI